MKKILAISGGVDSMCLLDMFKNDPEAIVAHFNHGTRPSSDDDQLFVAAFAKKYQLPFYTKKSILGPDVSEADARAARYDFLNELAEELNGKIYTAHHLNDLFESIAINITRGTGWRGLTPFNNSTIEHPLLHFSKTEIYRYAYANGIVYRQDPTNTDSSYLRNRLRPAIAAMIAKTSELPLYTDQDIDAVISRLQEKGYLDDQKFANYYVENRYYKKGISKKRLRNELQKKGISSDIIESTFNASTRSDAEEIQKIIQKKQHKYTAEKLIAYLLRQGFDYQQAKDAVLETDLQNSAQNLP